jgi:hypothetical protein
MTMILKMRTERVGLLFTCLFFKQIEDAGREIKARLLCER